jgi:hypothetical protein
MPDMTLARAWRRQLLGASSAALIVPATMFTALVVLALGGGFSQIGVLGQIFAGPPAPPVGAAASGHAGGTARLTAGALPVIPGASAGSAGHAPGARGGAGRGRVVPLSPGRPGRTGGALAPVGGAAPIVTQGAVGGAPRPSPSAGGSGSAPPGSAPSSPSPQPQPQPSPQPTPVDQVVQVVTSVTQQVPPPVGSAVTGLAQSAGSAADSLLPPAPPVPHGPGVP